MRFIAIVQAYKPIVHAWPDAPDEVHYLRHPHRHLMTIELAVDETHADRDVEFYILQDWLQGYLDDTEFVDSASCEMIAVQIIRAARAEGYAPAWCEVREDGGNGAKVVT